MVFQFELQWEADGQINTYNSQSIRLLHTRCVCPAFKNWRITQEFMKLYSDRIGQLLNN